MGSSASTTSHDPLCQHQTPRKYVGLQNNDGENNCFLNSTIQALWHLDSFRNALIRADIKSDQLLLSVIQGLFIQYQFTDLKIIPPTELRNALMFFDSSKFQLGEKADASEALEAILSGVHNDHVDLSGSYEDCNPPCVSHEVFGGLYISQAKCKVCGATDEPMIDSSSFLVYASASELLSSSRRVAGHSSFGRVLHSSLRTPQRHCPSLDTPTDLSPRPPACKGMADTLTWCLSPPLTLALCVSWDSESVSSGEVSGFLQAIEGRLFLDDLYRTDALPPSLPTSARPPTSPSEQERVEYMFRGFVCYYGRHYVSIFQDWTRGKHIFLLFDDVNIREIGTWPHVMSECIAARYQPVLLLYEKCGTKI